MPGVVGFFLQASGILFWVAVGVAVWAEKRSRRFLTNHKEDWPEPIFRKMLAQSTSQFDVLLVTLRRDTGRLGEAIEACRRGSGIMAIEDMVIRDEINKVLNTTGLMVIAKD